MIGGVPRVANKTISDVEQGLNRKRAEEYQKTQLDISKTNSQTSASNAYWNSENVQSEIAYRNWQMQQSKNAAAKLKNEQDFKTNFSSAQGNLAKIKAYYSGEGVSAKDYETYKGSATKDIYNALANVGITPGTTIEGTNNTLLDFVRNGGYLDNAEKMNWRNKLSSYEKDSKEYAQANRDFLNASINSVEGLSYDQIQALKLWNEIGTR